MKGDFGFVTENYLIKTRTNGNGTRTTGIKIINLFHSRLHLFSFKLCCYINTFLVIETWYLLLRYRDKLPIL